MHAHILKGSLGCGTMQGADDTTQVTEHVHYRTANLAQTQLLSLVS